MKTTILYPFMGQKWRGRTAHIPNHYSRLSLLALLVLCSLTTQAKDVNKHLAWTPYSTPESGLSWPQGQALPQFATPADTLDALDMRRLGLPSSERALFTVLQGLVNRNKPRIILFGDVREGNYKWPDNLGLHIRECKDKWQLLKKYQSEISGLVLYDDSKSIHYLNLASTLGGLRNALPVTPANLDSLKAAGFNFPVLADLTGLTYTKPSEIYQYLYDTYWKNCSKRLLVTLNARFPNYIRDMGVASGAAIVWLDPRKEEEAIVLLKFLGDMKAGESILIGWWAEERSGIGLGASYGISTIPADFYENSTVYAGTPHQIQLPVVPKKPNLENKVYLAIFLSDGDNVQYCQHAMSRLWDNKNRGEVPINWTVSPGLADFGPGLLNYYYSTATPNDFFSSGPSGLGYALIYDAHNKKWNMTKSEHTEAYTRFSQQYLEKTGLRLITLWDEISEEQMEIYTTNCRYLYGTTQEDWERSAPLKTIIKQNKLAFMPNHPCYAENINDIYTRWEKKIQAWDGKQPLFLAAQGVSWNMGPENIVLLREKLEKLSKGNIVVCRGDHFFTLFNEANGMDYNLTLSPEMEITSSPTSTQASCAADGSPNGEHRWVSSGKGKQWIRFDFKQPCLIDRYVLRHAGADGMDAAFNTRDFYLETSTDGRNWKTVSSCRDNTDQVTDFDLEPVQARFVRLVITDAGQDGITRIGDVEIYGKHANP